MTPGAREGTGGMRVDLEPLQREILGLLPAHGVELVAIEWLQGPGRGVLRIYIDLPGGDPRHADDPARPGLTADQCADVSRDVGSLLDALDLISGAYDLEVSSPGFERPVQRREDFERFEGLEVTVRTRVAVEGRQTFTGLLSGVKDLPGGSFAVRVTTRTGTVELPWSIVTRAKLSEVKPPPKAKPGKGPRVLGEQRRDERKKQGHTVTGAAERAGPMTEEDDAPAKDQRSGGRADTGPKGNT